MIRTMLQADARRAVGVLLVGVIFEPLARVSFAYWLALVAEGAVAGSAALATGGAAGYGASLALVGIANMLRVSWLEVLQEKTAFVLDRRLMELSTSLPLIEHHERPEYLDRVALIRYERARAGSGVSAIVVNLQVVVTLLGCVGLLATLNPWLMLLPVFAVPALLASKRSSTIVGRGADAGAAPLRRAQHLLAVGVSPAAGKEFRLFGLGSEIITRHQEQWQEHNAANARAEARSALLNVVGLVSFGIGFIGALAMVVLADSSGTVAERVGGMVLAFTLAVQINRLFSTAAFGLMALWLALLGYSRMLWLMDYAASRANEPEHEQAEVPDRIRSGIKFIDVNLRYPGTDRDVLSGINLVLPAGTTVAFVGENGAGKTSLVKLLSGFYRPSSGRILVDGVDLATLPPDKWRARLSAGLQDFVRFELLAAESVGIGDVPRVSDRVAVTDALVRADTRDVVDTLRDGLETPLGSSMPSGVDLSGGQWQKLALGRAMMRDRPLLLLLDEPTASLDAAGEHRIFEAQARAAQAGAELTGAITVLVSHRFSTTRMADHIVVIHGGRIAEQGTHAELMASGGYYAEMYSLQAQAYRS
jgi:ATP-binding cassette subfamily B protein